MSAKDEKSWARNDDGKISAVYTKHWCASHLASSSILFSSLSHIRLSEEFFMHWTEWFEKRLRNGWTNRKYSYLVFSKPQPFIISTLCRKQCILMKQKLSFELLCKYIFEYIYKFCMGFWEKILSASRTISFQVPIVSYIEMCAHRKWSS